MLPRNHQTIKSERDMMSGDMGISAVMAAASATKTCVQSGNWSDPTTWSGGTVPGAGEKVHIPLGKMVTYDVDSSTAIDWVRNDGSFKADTTKATRLVLDTFLSTLSSYFEIGNPVAPAAHTMEFVGGALMSGDMKEMSRGLLTIGRVMIHGEWRIPYAKLPNSVPAGATSITLPDQYDPQTGALRDTGAAVAATWQVGDKLCFPKCFKSTGDDDVTITAISGATVTFTPALAYDHSGAEGDPQALGVGNRQTPLNSIIHRHNSYVVNETKSIVFKSQDPTGVRGHAMIMHGRGISTTNKHYRRADHKSIPQDLGAEMDPGVHVCNAAWQDMGRTRTIFSPAIGEPGNTVGRYSLHFHRTGHWAQNPVLCKGNHIAGNIGWGLVRHDCHVAVDYCTARGVTAGSNVKGGGSLFVDEEDTELGAWTRLLGWGCRKHPEMNNNHGPGNENAFNGHAHHGDCLSANRNSSVREIIGIDCNHGLHLHQANTNTRLPDYFGGSTHPVDRRPDIEGMRRRSFVSHPVTWMNHEDNQPAGWFGCEFIYCNAGLSVFHRGVAYLAIDFHVSIENWTTTRVGTPISTTNYTYSYLMRGNSFYDMNGPWAFGDKAANFVWVKNRIEKADVFMATFGPLGSIANAGGGFADNVYVDVPAPDPAIAADLTNYDSSGWPAYTFGVEFYETPYSGETETIKYWITDGFVGNIKLWTFNETTVPDMGPKPGGYGRQGTSANWLHSKIRAPGSDWNRDGAMTAYEIVETWGCVPNGAGGHYVPLYFPLRDRLTGEMQWFRTEYDVSWMPSDFRAKHEIPADPGAPVAELVPSFPADYAPTTYGCFPDPDYAVHYVIADGKIHIDAYEAHRDLLVGQSRQVTRTYTFASGAPEELTLTIDGRGEAPSWIENPRITRQSDPNTWSSIKRGATFFAPKLMTMNYGLADGFPHPWSIGTAEFSSDGASFADNPINFGKMDALMTMGGNETGYDPYHVGYHKIRVSLENQHGSTAPIETNEIQITAT